MAISPGMKKRIRAGQYDFPDTEWRHVSKDGEFFFSILVEKFLKFKFLFLLNF